LQEVAEFMDNILARSRLSMQARQSEQLATIGLIGASLAHEIRNPSSRSRPSPTFLALRFDDPDFRRRFSQLIPAEVERIDNLTQQLLDLSNPAATTWNGSRCTRSCRRRPTSCSPGPRNAGVALTAQFNAMADSIWADASAMRQVLINLLINAFQALRKPGRRAPGAAPLAQFPNGSIILEVSDNGPGIPTEQRARLFHPFVPPRPRAWASVSPFAQISCMSTGQPSLSRTSGDPEPHSVSPFHARHHHPNHLRHRP